MNFLPYGLADLYLPLEKPWSTSFSNDIVDLDLANCGKGDTLFGYISKWLRSNKGWSVQARLFGRFWVHRKNLISCPFGMNKRTQSPTSDHWFAKTSDFLLHSERITFIRNIIVLMEFTKRNFFSCIVHVFELILWLFCKQ